MNDNNSDRRLGENQVSFRSYNEKVQAEIDNYNKTAKEEGDPPLNVDSGTTFHFYCECSDNDCKMRIRMTLCAYNMIHCRRDTFSIAPGHDLPEVENVILDAGSYMVVQKKNYPNQDRVPMHENDVHNV